MKTVKSEGCNTYRVPICKRRYVKNNKQYIITAFRIIMLQKRTTLNKLLHNSDPIFK